MTPVAVYARASSAEQTTSVGDQLAALRKEAVHRKYTIVAEYVDDGLSGSKDIEKRIAFHRMVADSYRKDFQRIFCFDTSRFGRLDSLDASEHKSKLRKNGVEGIDTIGEGFIDWHTQMGRIVDAISSEANHEAALKISRAVIRGRLAQLERKIYPHGMIPFGYARQYTADDGTIKVVPRAQKFRKPKSWTRKLIIDESEAAVVRRIFDMFTRQGLSQRTIAKKLTSENIPSGGGEAGWSGDTVKRVLTSRAYLGYCVVNAAPKKTTAHNRVPGMEVPGVIPAIVTERMWTEAKAIISQGKKTSWKSTQTNRALAGILVCGMCGYRLVARQRQKGRTSGTGYQPVYYSCTAGQKRGKISCPQYRVTEAEVLPRIVRELVATTDNEILQQLTISSAVPPTVPVTTHLIGEVADLRAKLQRAAMRAATADDELFDALTAAAKTIKANLDAAEDRLRFAQNVQQDGGLLEWVGWWDSVREGLTGTPAEGEFAALQEKWDTELKRLGESLGAVPPKKTRPGEWRQWWESVRDSLLRVAPDGDTSPARGVLEVLEGGNVKLTDSQTIRGILRRLGCTVTVWWVPNPDKRGRRNDVDYVVDRLKIEFECRAPSAGSDKHGPTDSTSGRKVVLVRVVAGSGPATASA